ncbi:MAG: alkaline phosphatase family protein [Planctomycetota bacterium]|jgi:predicted AlkP superfamily phosphohydrolase/phosphomutase
MGLDVLRCDFCCFEFKKGNMGKKQERVLIIGLDGFTWKIGNKLIQEGHMPMLGGLVKNGCHGKLKSVMPFETGPAWSSFQTGCHPNNTGIFSFHTFDSQTKQIRLNSFCDICTPTLWELLHDNNKEVVSINMPVTAPPPRINGVIIPGMLCPGLNEQTIHPPEIYQEYIKKQKHYHIVDNTRQKNIADFVNQSCRVEESRCEVALDIMNQKEWDVFCVQIQSTDLFQHRYWWSVDPEANGYSEDYFNEASRFYHACDRIIERLVRNADADTVMIVSDHGFTKQRYAFAINRWLHQKGFLKLFKEKKQHWKKTKNNHALLKRIAKIYGRFGKLVKNIGGSFSKIKSRPFNEIELIHLRQLIDFEGSCVFGLGGMAGVMYINDSLTGEDFSSLLKNELLSEFGPTSKRPIIRTIKTGIEEYGEPAIGVSLPNLIIEYAEGVCTIIHPHAEQVITDYNTSKQQPGTHARDGIVIVQGDAFKQGYEYNAEIVDIVPTILAAMGLAVPNHMDGKVLLDAFKQPPYIQYSEVLIKKKKTVNYSNQEQAEVEKRLADLGYL